MKKFMFFTLSALALCACEMDFDIEKQMKDGVTYIKFVPSNSDDTTFFHVQATTALKDGINPDETVGESVNITVNGVPVTLTKDEKKSHSGIGQVYWTTYLFKGGDVVSAEASVPGREPVCATATVPEPLLEFRWKARIKDNPDSCRFLCVDIEYVNKPGLTGHYGVAVRAEKTLVKQEFQVHKDKPDTIEWGEPVTTVTVKDEYPLSASDMLLTSLGSEPLVLDPSSLNRDYRWNLQYGENVSGSDSQLHRVDSRVVSWTDHSGKTSETSMQQIWVNYDGKGKDFEAEIPEGYWEWDWTGDTFVGIKSHSEIRYKLVFYVYEDNCFNYLKAQQSENSGLILFGLAPALFTFTNVRNGVGVCGSYMTSETEWLTLEE